MKTKHIKTENGNNNNNKRKHKRKKARKTYLGVAKKSTSQLLPTC